jgi:HK97 family phage major capsid protein
VNTNRLGKAIGFRRNGQPIYLIAGGAPTPLEVMEARLAELRKESEALYDQRGALIDKAASEKRGFTDAEQATYDEASTKREAIEKEIGPVAERVTELREQDKREKAAAAARVETGEAGEQRGNATVTDPPVYVRNGGNGQSYFRDLAKAKFSDDPEAASRLRRNSAMAQESRALGNTNAAGGSGGEFAPPAWLVDDYVALVRAGRVTANLFNAHPIPAGTSSINLPKVLTGTTVALQSSQNSALSQTDLTTGSVQTGFATLGGKQLVSQQLLDQSALNFDQVILGDLASAYAQQVGSQVLNGTGTGSGTNAVVNGLANATAGTTTTWTQASPTVAGFYGQSAKTLAAFETARYAPPTAWLMHPRRWYWLVAQVDSNNRPLVVPQGNAFNPVATQESMPAAGLAGMYLGLPVYIDPNIATNGGAGTNQDNVYLLKQDDLWFFESTPQPEVFRETYADSAGVLFRMMGYVGTILNRYTASIAVISGTGLVTPAFAS